MEINGSVFIIIYCIFCIFIKQSWFSTSYRCSMNYLTLFTNVFPLLLLNVVSDQIASLLNLQRICNLSMHCTCFHGYQISVNGTQSEKKLQGEAKFGTFFHFFFFLHFPSQAVYVMILAHFIQQITLYQDHSASCLYLFDCSTCIDPWKLKLLQEMGWVIPNLRISESWGSVRTVITKKPEYQSSFYIFKRLNYNPPKLSKFILDWDIINLLRKCSPPPCTA